MENNDDGIEGKYNDENSNTSEKPTSTTTTTTTREITCGLSAYETFLTNTNQNDSELAQACYQVHEDLRVIRKWTQLEVKNRTDGTPIIIGLAPSQTDALYSGERRRYVLPVLANVDMTAAELFRLGMKDERCVTIAIVDDDSTTAYYRVFTDWNEIVHPQWKSKSKEEDSPDEDSDD